MNNKHELRLNTDQELITWDGKTLIEKVKVVEVDKKEKTATLSNGIKVNRYPSRVDGEVIALTYYRVDQYHTSKNISRTWAISDKSLNIWEAYLDKVLLREVLDNWVEIAQKANPITDADEIIKMYNKIKG